MSLTKIDLENGLQKISQWFETNSVVPFFGAGFTKGCKAKNGNVPDADDCIRMMNSVLLKKGLQDDELEDDFFEVASLFFDKVSKEEREKFLQDYFTSVCLEDLKKDFLNLKWKYAYTLNIDDGIEKNSDFCPVVIQNDIEPKQDLKVVYKIHGDALSDTLYKKNFIVFDKEQYLSYLLNDENATLLNLLKADYNEKNLLFLGCSLKDEMDLKHIYSSVKNDKKNVERVWITNKEPDSKYQRRLEAHGINEYICISSFDDFYSRLIKIINNKKIIDDYKYKNPSINFVSSNDKEGTFAYFCGNRLFDDKNNLFNLTHLHIERDCVDEISSKLEDNNFILLKGRHFSGKTYVLASLVNKIKNKQIIFFPSFCEVDSNVVSNLFLNTKDTIFLFDSNSITPSIYDKIKEEKDTIINNGNKLVMAINSNDLLDRLQADLVELLPYFSQNEINKFEDKAKRYSLYKRKPSEYNIDYLFRIKDEQRFRYFNYFNIDKEKYTEKEYKLIFLLDVCDKIYSADAQRLNFSSSDLRKFVSKTDNLVEIEKTERFEAYSHSSEKIVHNSKAYLTSLLLEFKRELVIKAIVDIVKCFKKDNFKKDVLKNCILFDNLNGIFKNAASIITDLYSDLEEFLYDDGHFWLQRAKSISHNSRSNLDDLCDAFGYVQSAIQNAGNDDSLFYKATLTKAFISSRLFALEEGEQKYTDMENAIDAAYTALFINNREYRSFYRIFSNKRNRAKYNLLDVCNYCIQKGFPCSQKAQEIIFKINDIERNKI